MRAVAKGGGQLLKEEGNWRGQLLSLRGIGEGTCAVRGHKVPALAKGGGHLVGALALETGSWCPNSCLRAFGEGILVESRRRSALHLSGCAYINKISVYLGPPLWGVK